MVANPELRFRGAVRVTLDDKGRVVVPTRQRDILRTLCGGKVITTIERERCLLIYPYPEWEAKEQELQGLSNMDEQVYALNELMVGHAQELQLDGHGRLSLPTELREFASLDRRAMLVGQLTRLELWNEETWIERREHWIKVRAHSQGVAPALGKFSI
ncbi:MAG: division/cell wall cluster transcriptional repressor MraZ [Steroidobacteraceae bacterium]